MECPPKMSTTLVDRELNIARKLTFGERVALVRSIRWDTYGKLVTTLRKGEVCRVLVYKHLQQKEAKAKNEQK